MFKSIIVTLCSLIGFSLNAQVNLDSLYAVWKDQKQLDSIRTRAYTDYIWDGFLFSQPDRAYILAEELVEFGVNKNYLRAQYAGYTLQGVSRVNKSDYPRTLYFYKKALEIAEQMGDPDALGTTYNNVGSIYQKMGDYSKALDHYIRSLEYKEPERSGTILNNIGTIYFREENYSKALEYHLLSLELSRKNGNKDEEASALINIGDIYRAQKNFPKSLDYYSQSLIIYEQIGHQIGIAQIYLSIGLIYYEQEEYTLALDYRKKGLNIFEQIDDKNGIAISLNNIGEVYYKLGEYGKSIDYCQRGFEISLEINSLLRKLASCSCLYDAHKALKNDDKALYYFELFKAVEDSLDTQETAKKLQEMEFQEEARQIQEVHEEDIRQKEKTRNISLIVGAFFLLLAGSFYIRWRYVRKSRATIQIEKDRSDHLLLNILPKEVAQELKESGKAAPKKYENVTILFTDFKDFTKLTASIPASMLVVELNEIFGKFDDIMDEFGIENLALKK